jgi:hypothetical protein
VTFACASRGSPAVTIPPRAISASRGVSSFSIAWVGWLLAAPFSLIASGPRFRSLWGECRFGTGKAPGKKPTGGGQRAQSARSRQGGAKGPRRHFGSEVPGVTHELAFTLPRKLTTARESIRRGRSRSGEAQKKTAPEGGWRSGGPAGGQRTGRDVPQRASGSAVPSSRLLKNSMAADGWA